MVRRLTVLILGMSVFGGCKQAAVTGSNVASVDGVDDAVPGPEAFEGGPEAACDADGLKLIVTFGPPRDFKWARLSDAPVQDGNPRVDYLRGDSSRVLKDRNGHLSSGRWQKVEPGKDPIEVKVLFPGGQQPTCELSGYEISAEQKARR